MQVPGGPPSGGPPLRPRAPDQSADLAAELDRRLLRQVAEVFDLAVSFGVLVDGERVDHTDRVAPLAEPLELGDHFTVEVGVIEAQHEKLDRSNCHLGSPSVGVTESPPAASPTLNPVRVNYLAGAPPVPAANVDPSAAADKFKVAG